MKSITADIQCDIDSVVFMVDKQLDTIVPIEIDTINITIDEYCLSPTVMYHGHYAVGLRPEVKEFKGTPNNYIRYYNFRNSDINKSIFFALDKAEQALQNLRKKKISNK